MVKIPKWVLLLSVALLGSILLFVALRNRTGLSYGGRSLHSWLDDFGTRPIGGGLIHNTLRGKKKFGRDATRVAIRAMGTNALDFVLREIKRPDEPSWLATTKDFLQKQKLLTLPLRDAQTRREQAALGIYELGQAGVPALPELANLLLDHKHATSAAYALAGMGPDAVPAYQAALSHTNDWIADCGVWGLAQIGRASKVAVPDMLGLLRRSNPADVQITVWALGEIRDPVDLIVPELTRLTGHTNTGVRGAAIQALEKFGPELTNSLPVFRANAEQESDPNVQNRWQQLLRNLGPGETTAN